MDFEEISKAFDNFAKALQEALDITVKQAEGVCKAIAAIVDNSITAEQEITCIQNNPSLHWWQKKRYIRQIKKKYNMR